MTLLRYVLIGIISVLLVACESGEEVSVSGTYDGSPITLTLGKTTFDQIYNTNRFTLDSPSILNAPKVWKTLKGKYSAFKIPYIGDFNDIYLDFYDDTLVAIRLTSTKFINTSLLKQTLAVRFNEVPSNFFYKYASGNGVSVFLRENPREVYSFKSLTYVLDTTLKEQPFFALFVARGEF